MRVPPGINDGAKGLLLAGEPVRLGIVGLGGWSGQFFKATEHVEDAEIVVDHGQP